MKRILVAFTTVSFILLLSSCGTPVDPGTTPGSLNVSINDSVSRTLLPALSMNPASYDLAGSGPGGATFAMTITSGSSATVEKLAFGSWNVVATAKNASGTPIGSGSGTAVIHSNSTTSLAITVVPYEGFGTLSLNLGWTASDIETAQVEAGLLPASGAARPLTFTVDGPAGTAQFDAADVATGYHTLTLKLLDNGALAMGAVEVVRIVKEQATSGSFAFANVNKPGGTLAVNILPEMADPLTVSIAGASATKPVNQTMSLAATIAESGVNATYVWYVNGDAVETEASFDFGTTWAQGYYRIDVTAFSSDGKRAGSGTASVQVVATSSDYAIGDTGPAGGFVFYDKGSYSDGWRYLEAAPGDQDQGMGILWYNGNYTTTGAIATGIGDGAANTATIIASQGAGNYAAQLCADLVMGGCDGWFLPSKDELNQMYVNLKAQGRGGFASDYYWSSSEVVNDAWIQNFVNGSQVTSGKYYYGRVRAVRAF